MLAKSKIKPITFTFSMRKKETKNRLRQVAKVACGGTNVPTKERSSQKSSKNRPINKQVVKSKPHRNDQIKLMEIGLSTNPMLIAKRSQEKKAKKNYSLSATKLNLSS